MASNRVQVTQTVAANLKVDPSAVTSPVSVVSLPLPTGAATSALQAGGLPAALGAGGGLKVDGSGTALPVSGTVTANAGTNLNTSALATAAKQPALGTAGTASADVITVQGVASGYPVAVGLNQLNISQTPTVSTSPAYTAGDALGGLLTFANAARVSGLSGILQAITVMCKTPALVPAIDLYLFNQTFTATSDNAAFAPSDGDMANCIGYIPIAAWAAETASSLNSLAARFGIGFPYTLTGTSLFGQMVTRTAFTAGGTTDFVVGIQVWRD